MKIGMGTTNGTEYGQVKWQTCDGFVYNNYTQAAIHAYEQQGRTSAGSYIQPIDENYYDRH